MSDLKESSTSPEDVVPPALCFFMPFPVITAIAASDHNPDEVREKASQLITEMTEIAQDAAKAVEAALEEAVEHGKEEQVNTAPQVAKLDPVESSSIVKVDVPTIQSTATITEQAPPNNTEEPVEGLNRRVYDLQSLKSKEQFPGILMRSEGQPPLDVPAVDRCYTNLGLVYRFFKEIFGRDSVDGEGMELVGVVHFDNYFPGAWWGEVDSRTRQQGMVFGDGWANREGVAAESFAGYFGNFVGSLEVVAHEIMHGITRHMTGLHETGQPGALHEHLSDVFGSMAEQWHKRQDVHSADWLIGEDLILPARRGAALRSMKAPGTAYDFPGIHRDEQVAHYGNLFKISAEGDEVRAVHINSGILNLAFYKAAMALGGNSWETAGQIWWRALQCQYMPASCNFKQWAQVTVDTASNEFNTATAQVVKDAWSDVGIETKLP